MSLWEEAFEDPLLGSPWLPLPTSPASLVKYAPHPHRPGYILLLTDLSGVYVDSLLAPSIPGRLNEIKRTYKRRNNQQEDEDDDVIKQSEAALGRLGHLFADSEALGECEVELKDHDYHDKVLSVHADGWDWLFNLTELRGREPIQILARQLVSPLAEALAKAQDLEVPKGTKKKSPSSVELVSAVFADEGVRALLYPDGSSSRGEAKAKEEGQGAELEAKENEKSRVAENQQDEEGGDDVAEEGGEEEEEEYRSSPEPPAASKSPSPPKTRGKRKSPSVASRHSSIAPPSASASKSASPTPPITRSQPPSKRKIAASNPSTSASSASGSVSPAKPPSKRKKDPDLEAANLAPPTQSSQKSKKQREEEEEEELDRKLNEMKRKMGSGGGGRLGKRRMAR